MNISGFLWNGEKQHHPLKKYIIQTKVKIQKTFLFYFYFYFFKGRGLGKPLVSPKN